MLAQETTLSMFLPPPPEILKDYRLGWRSRHASLIGRREVLSGKAKFGIFGDGKELPQLAMARAFHKGDFRAGYYRDQTIMFALELLTIEQFFAQLYAHTDVEAEPCSAGRSMNGHYLSRALEADGTWKDLTAQYNSTADVSPTGTQMPRAVGLAYASRLYRQLPELQPYAAKFSDEGNEIVFGTIGNASTAEGMFWESVNAIGVLKSPAVLSVYDDGYGISVTNDNQVVKADVGEILTGFRRRPGPCCDGYDIYIVKGWDYPALIKTYARAAEAARADHLPNLVHVTELTQPQGHSTSGSHERYKSKERLAWEAEYDCLKKFRQWILAEGIASAEELDRIEEEELQFVEEGRKRAWEASQAPLLRDRREAADHLATLAAQSSQAAALRELREKLLATPQPLRRDVAATLHDALVLTRNEPSPARQEVVTWRQNLEAAQAERFATHLYSQSSLAALKVPVVPPAIRDTSPLVPGFEVLNACFDAALGRDPRVVAFGEDVGKLGDVNQAFHGLQAKYGELRVADTGIRETTILGQAIGLAMRGLRPIAEIQYLDYLLYALQLMSDELATMQWRTKGGQKAPVIVRTRGHRLEGIWHSGSPMGGILHLVRGMYVLTPRNMVQAAGFYNTMLRSDDPALIVEVLNAYRQKERLPDNIGEFTLPLGVPEILRPGTDVSIVTYGACCRLALEAAEKLAQAGIEAEVIDVQSLLPFDRPGIIGKSLQKTSRILFVDEDVPGGATAYMLQQVLEGQNGYQWLDSAPRTLPASDHRPAYGSDGDYWSKPNAEQIFDAVYDMMHEADPGKYPSLVTDSPIH